MFSISLSRYPEYTKVFFFILFETLKIKVGKKHKSFRVCAAARGRHSPRISTDLYLSPQMVQHRLLHTR